MENSFELGKLLEQLMAVGFPAGLEWEINVHACFMPLQFSIRYEQYRSGDHLCYTIVIKQNETKGEYQLVYYDAALRKGLDIPEDVADVAALRALNQEMLLLNWNSLLTKGAEPTVGDLAELKQVAAINQKLSALESSENGSRYAQLMKARYWIQTPFESYVPATSALRQELEVSQRFHFFEGEDGITLEEAYRFLLHRWREKKLQNLQRSGKAVQIVKNKIPGKR
jgi:hypothetical protein